jgi:ABC-type Fe3+-citrate transport system substrate-binding protein
MHNNIKRWSPVVVIIGLLIALFFVRQCQNTETETKTNETVQSEKVVRGLNRNPSKINYSKHARCRMD